MNRNLISAGPRRCRWPFLKCRAPSAPDPAPSAGGGSRPARPTARRCAPGGATSPARQRPFAPPGTQHRGLNTQLRRHLCQRPPAALQQRYRLPLELVRERSSCLRDHQRTSLPQELIRGVHPTGGRSVGPPSPGRHMDGTVRGLFAARLAHRRALLGAALPDSPGGRRDMGLGPYPEITLAAAREKALEARRLVKVEGRDPLAERRRTTVLHLQGRRRGADREQAAGLAQRQARGAVGRDAGDLRLSRSSATST